MLQDIHEREVVLVKNLTFNGLPTGFYLAKVTSFAGTENSATRLRIVSGDCLQGGDDAIVDAGLPMQEMTEREYTVALDEVAAY